MHGLNFLTDSLFTYDTYVCIQYWSDIILNNLIQVLIIYNESITV